MHCVPRQNKLETPRDKDEVNKREIRECDGRAHDPDTMVVPLTPKPTQKTEALVRAPPTIASSRYCNGGSPTDTQADTKSRSPRQGAADHSIFFLKKLGTAAPGFVCTTRWSWCGGTPERVSSEFCDTTLVDLRRALCNANAKCLVVRE